MEWIVLFVLFVLVLNARSTISDLKEQLDKQAKDLLDLRLKLGDESRAARPRAAEPTPVRAVDATLPPAPIERPRPAVVRQPDVAPAPVRLTPPPVVASKAEPVPFAASDPAMAGAMSARPPAPPPTPPLAPPPRGPSRPTSPPPVPPPERKSFDWESLIGVKLFSWVAGAALALAAIFFLRYSLDAGWLRPEIRMAIGLATGIALLVGCELKAARKYPQTANALDASGIAILFASVFASFALWHLVPATLAFAMLVIVTAVAVLLSIRRGSMFIAVLGLLGGFATPAMLSTGQDNPIGLFSYLLLLNSGLAWVAYRKRWPALTALSVVFTTVYQWGWVVKFLNADKLPIAVGIFLVFPVLSIVALAVGGAREAAEPDDKQGDVSPWFAPSLFRRASRASALLPLLFSLYFAAVPAYGARFGLLFGFLFVIAAGLFVLSITQGPRSLHFLGALSTVVVFAVWFKGSATPESWPWVLGIVSASVLLYLAAPWLARVLRDETFDGLAARAVFAAPLLLFAFPVLLVIEPRAATPALTFGVLFALLGACAVYAVRQGEGAVHYVAAFFALAAEAVWSTRYLNAERLYSALGLYGTFGLFYLGAPVFARRLRKPFEPKGAAGLLTLVSLALLFFLAMGPVAQSALWGMALLIAVLNVGLMYEASYCRMPLLSLIGAGLSWLLLAVWWFTVGVAAMLVPALVVMGGFALLTLGGNVAARRRAEQAGEASSGFDANVFAALVGHVFVAFVATRPELSIPPWPVLGVMFVLDLAVLAAALYIRRGSLHLAATVATAIVLGLWTFTARVAPWPMVAVLAAGASALIAFIAMPLARRVRATDGVFALAAAAAVILSQGVAFLAQSQPGSPSLAFLLGAQIVLATAAMSLSWIDVEQLGWSAVVAVLPFAGAGALWTMRHDTPADWSSQLAMSTPMFLLFVAHPLALGRRVGRTTLPYVATVLASAAYFFLARHSLMLGGYGAVIGALPIAMAVLLAPVLAQLVRLERMTTKHAAKAGPIAIATDRLALVAATILAFVTVAIPLQLDRNWITIGWALEGAALVWLVRRIPHAGLLTAAVALLVTAFVRLALNPAVLTYHPRGAVPVLNWYLYTYLLCATALFASAWLVRKARAGLLGPVSRWSALFTSGGAVLLFLLLNIEIADFYAVGATITFNFNANLAQDLTYTLGWAVFAIALLAAGIIGRNRSARLASIVLLVVTVLKCFLHDLGRLGGLYRVGSFVGLALSLALVAIAIQKFVLAKNEPAPGEARA